MVKFFLKDKNSEEETAIRMHCFYKGKNIIIYTGFKVLPDNWVRSEQKVTSDLKKYRNGKKINNVLFKMKEEAEATFFEVKDSGKVVDSEMFKDLLKQNLAGKNLGVKGEPGFIDRLISYTDKEESLKGNRFVHKLRATVKLIKDFDKDWTSLTLSSFNFKYYIEFTNFLLLECGYAPNYVGGIVTQLKKFLKYTFREGLHKNIDYLDFKIIKIEVDTVALTPKQVHQIWNLSIENDLLCRIRDFFMVQCTTGLRYVDVTKLTRANINKWTNTLDVTTTKTKARVTIPIQPILWNIINKYEDSFPRKVYAGALNIKIKEIAKSAGLIQKVQIVKIRRGGEVRKDYPLYKLVTSHTGRRTALTNMYLQGVKLEELRLISGHTSIKQLQTYLKIDSKVSAEILQDNPFFKGELPPGK